MNWNISQILTQMHRFLFVTYSIEINKLKTKESRMKYHNTYNGIISTTESFVSCRCLLYVKFKNRHFKVTIDSVPLSIGAA